MAGYLVVGGLLMVGAGLFIAEFMDGHPIALLLCVGGAALTVGTVLVKVVMAILFP